MSGYVRANLELLTEMKPSFCCGRQAMVLPEKLARIAPAGDLTSVTVKPLAVARQSLQEMAQLFNLQASAERHLTEYDRFIASLKPRFIQRGARYASHFLLDSRHMLVFGPNSLFQDVLDDYGIPNAWQGETNFGAALP